MNLRKNTPVGTRLKFVGRSLYCTTSRSTARSWHEALDRREGHIFTVASNDDAGLILGGFTSEFYNAVDGPQHKSTILIPWPYDSDVDWGDDSRVSILVRPTERLMFRFEE